jgi:hypothetical protein
MNRAVAGSSNMLRPSFVETENGYTPHCPRDGDRMSLVNVLPHFASFPELRTFRCDRCGHVDTFEVLLANDYPKKGRAN